VTHLVHPDFKGETGETAMFAIFYDWTPFGTGTKTEAPTNHSIKINKKYCREEEFNSALEVYLADYCRHRDLVADKTAQPIAKTQIPLGRRTEEMLRFQAWF
jgi:hypothetical protein